jgi:hypothetical protein
LIAVAFAAKSNRPDDRREGATMPGISSHAKQANMIAERAMLDDEAEGFIAQAQAVAMLEMLGEQAKTPSGKSAVDKALADIAAHYAARTDSDDPLAALMAATVGGAGKAAKTAKPANPKVGDTFIVKDLGGGVTAEIAATYKDKQQVQHLYTNGPSLRLRVEGQARYQTIPVNIVKPILTALADDANRAAILAAMDRVQQGWADLAG